MGRGLTWSQDETMRLKSLVDDNTGKKYTEIADIAIKYGMFPKRTKSALTSQIGRMMKPESSEEDETQVDIFAEIQMAEYEEIVRKYNELVTTILETATPWPTGNGMKLNFNAIMRWMYKNEGDRTARRAAELEEERETAEKPEEKKKRTRDDERTSQRKRSGRDS